MLKSTINNTGGTTMNYTRASRSQGQPLPEHVHEDGNDQPGLQQHERDDQKPPQVSLNVEEVDKIGRSAENKQQPPDLEINANRMLLPLWVCHGFPLPKIENCEDEYPHQIDEVPIQTHDFDHLVVPLPAGQETG